MPNRIIREGINDSLRVNALPQLTELFYRRLQLLVDDYGRYEAEPILLRAKLYGLRPDVTVAEVCEHLRALASGGKPLIVVYETEDKKYLEIQGFGQRTRTEKYPAPSNARICEQPLARASDTNTRSNTTPNTKSNTQERSPEGNQDFAVSRADAKTETPPISQNSGGMNRKAAIKLDDSFERFEEAAAKADMGMSDEDRIDLSAMTWPRMDIEQKLKAVDTIYRRIESGEYSNGYTPKGRRYLEKKLYTAPDRKMPARKFKNSAEEYLFGGKTA